MKTITLKTFIAIFCMAVVSATAFAQTPSGSSAASTSKASSKSSMEEWTALKEFHKVMAQTFHPMEEGDYKPIRERSGELAEKARLLAESKVPADFNKPEMLKAIQELNAGSRLLDAAIKNKATDAEINKSLTELHETFHKIVGMCQPGDNHEQNEHHEHSDPNHK